MIIALVVETDQSVAERLISVLERQTSKESLDAFLVAASHELRPSSQGDHTPGDRNELASIAQTHPDITHAARELPNLSSPHLTMQSHAMPLPTDRSPGQSDTADSDAVHALDI